MRLNNRKFVTNILIQVFIFLKFLFHFSSKFTMVQTTPNPKSRGGPLVQLNSGYSMPLVGLGTYKLTGSQELVNRAVDAALGKGYRHFDTAKLYLNEKELGNALEVGRRGFQSGYLWVSKKFMDF